MSGELEKFNRLDPTVAVDKTLMALVVRLRHYMGRDVRCVVTVSPGYARVIFTHEGGEQVEDVVAIGDGPPRPHLNNPGWTDPVLETWRGNIRVRSGQSTPQVVTHYLQTAAIDPPPQPELPAANTGAITTTAEETP